MFLTVVQSEMFQSSGSGTQKTVKKSTCDRGNKIVKTGKAKLFKPLESGARRIFDARGKKEPL